jgi:hypothetical protein
VEVSKKACAEKRERGAGPSQVGERGSQSLGGKNPKGANDADLPTKIRARGRAFGGVKSLVGQDARSVIRSPEGTAFERTYGTAGG